MHTYSITIDNVTTSHTASSVGEAVRQRARQQGLNVSDTFSIGDLLEMIDAPVTIREDGEVVSSHVERRRRMGLIETRANFAIGEASAESGPDEIIAPAERGWPEGRPLANDSPKLRAAIQCEAFRTVRDAYAANATAS